MRVQNSLLPVNLHHLVKFNLNIMAVESSIGEGLTGEGKVLCSLDPMKNSSFPPCALEIMFICYPEPLEAERPHRKTLHTASTRMYLTIL